MIRCPIYNCSKLSGCRTCKILRGFNSYPGLKLLSTNRRNLNDTFNTIKKCKNSGTAICLITEKEIPKELVWELTYSSQNTLQIHVCMLSKSENLKWVTELVHLSEICGIRCVLVLYPIVPAIVTTTDIIKIIDSIRNCEHCKICLKFAEITLNKSKCSKGNLKLDGYSIPLAYLEKFHEFLWKCSSLYSEDFFQTVKFFTDGINVPLVSI